jgi:hypothetical protein
MFVKKKKAKSELRSKNFSCFGKQSKNNWNCAWIIYLCRVYFGLGLGSNMCVEFEFSTVLYSHLHSFIFSANAILFLWLL